jgi:hypothetical protein
MTGNPLSDDSRDQHKLQSGRFEPIASSWPTAVPTGAPDPHSHSIVPGGFDVTS